MRIDRIDIIRVLNTFSHPLKQVSHDLKIGMPC